MPKNHEFSRVQLARIKAWVADDDRVAKMVADLPAVITQLQKERRQLQVEVADLHRTRNADKAIRGLESRAVKWHRRDENRYYTLECANCGAALGPRMTAEEENDDKS